jgi:hypothetical protein
MSSVRIVAGVALAVCAATLFAVLRSGHERARPVERAPRVADESALGNEDEPEVSGGPVVPVVRATDPTTADDGVVDVGLDVPPSPGVAEFVTSLEARYPLLADEVALRGVPLRDLDLDSLTGAQFEELDVALRECVRRIEADYFAECVDWKDRLMSPNDARELYEVSPDTYFARLPSALRRTLPPGPTRYLPIQGSVPQSLIEARNLSIEINVHPTFEALKISRTTHNPIDEQPTGVVSWRTEQFGQVLVGLDARGVEVTRVVSAWCGVP